MPFGVGGRDLYREGSVLQFYTDICELHVDKHPCFVRRESVVLGLSANIGSSCGSDFMADAVRTL